MRGPKARTAENSGRGFGFIHHDTLDPPSELNDAARAEYDRLVEILGERGTLERVDLAVVAECSRIKAMLDAAYRNVSPNPEYAEAKLIGLLTSQRRGLLRELGLTLHPSKSMIKVNPVGSERADSSSPWEGKLKVS